MVDLSHKVELFSSRLPMETFRQWCELIVGVTIFVWFIYSALKLKQTLKSWLILDVMLIVSLAIRVLLFLIYEFLLPSRILTFFGDIIYVAVLMMIFYSFSKALYPDTGSRIWNRNTYVIVVCVVLVITLIYSFATMEESFHCDDDVKSSGHEINSLVLGFVELSVGTFNLIFSYRIINTLGARSKSQEAIANDDRATLLREMLDQEEDTKLAKKQLLIVGYGGFICSIIRGIRVIVSFVLIKYSDDFVC